MPTDRVRPAKVERRCPPGVGSQSDDGVVAGQLLVGGAVTFEDRGNGGLGRELADEVEVGADGGHGSVSCSGSVSCVYRRLGIDRSSLT
jgi:hypothetical protein